jgi:calcium homeostasis ER protein
MVANVQQMPVSPLSMPVNPSNLPHPRCKTIFNIIIITIEFKLLSLVLLPNQPPNLGSRPPLQFDGPPPPPSSVAMFLPLVHQQPPPPPPTSNANQTSQPLLLPQLHQTSQMPVRLGPVPQLPQPLVPPNQPFSGPLSAPHFPSPLSNHQFFNAVHNSAPIPPKEVIPDVPYYELPAGLMAPLVKLEDFEYKSIVPKDIRLPPPAPPNERLLQAVELFYAPPTHERPRNSDGWEQLGLYEFFKAKSQAKKDKEEIPSIASNEIENFEVFSVNSINSDTSTINNEKPENNQISAETNSKHNQSSEQSLPSSHSRHRSPSPKRRYREYREEKR